MPYFEHDAIRFHFRESGQGTPVVFQHGMGGSLERAFGLFTPPPGFRLLAMDFRCHGQTQPAGPAERISMASFADDLVALLDYLEVPRAVIGGVSLGAAVTLNLALRYPQRMMGLVQSRPAWLAEPNRRNAGWYGEIAQLIREYGAREGGQRFRHSALYAELSQESPDVAQSMLSQFDNPRLEDIAVVLERMRLDTPCASLRQLLEIHVPTLVMANRQDPVHPFEYGQVIAAGIPGAEFHEITAKSVSAQRHQQDVQRHLGDFLQRHFA